MTPEADSLWQRAKQALQTAESTLSIDAHAASARAYYAAFYGVSALFALRGRTFSKHSAVEAAVHRDLIKTKEWPVGRGKDYSFLLRLRSTGDYGGGLHVAAEEAADAIAVARRILQAVHKTSPETFSREDS